MLCLWLRKPPKGSTFCWRPNEHSLLRNSFNCIVGQTKLDVTEVMIRNASMGRQAEMGPRWSPGGLASRRRGRMAKWIWSQDGQHPDW